MGRASRKKRERKEAKIHIANEDEFKDFMREEYEKIQTASVIQAIGDDNEKFAERVLEELDNKVLKAALEKMDDPPATGSIVKIFWRPGDKPGEQCIGGVQLRDGTARWFDDIIIRKSDASNVLDFAVAQTLRKQGIG